MLLVTTLQFCTGKQHYFSCAGKSNWLSLNIWVIPCQVIHKMGIFHLTLSKIHEIYKGKDLRLLSSIKLVLKSDLYFWNYEHLKFWCFSRGFDQTILGVLLLELQLIVTPLSLNIYIQYFAVKWKAPAEQNNTESFSLGAFEPCLIVVIRQHVFHVRSSMMIF